MSEVWLETSFFPEDRQGEEIAQRLRDALEIVYYIAFVNVEMVERQRTRNKIQDPMDQITRLTQRHLNNILKLGATQDVTPDVYAAAT